MELEASNEERVAYSVPPLVHPPHPWLVLCHGNDRERQTFFSISENRYYPRLVPEMYNKFISTANFGWLLLDDYESDGCSLLNLGSMEKLQLPTPKQFPYRFSILSAPPTDPSCHVMFFHEQENSVLLCKPGDDVFIKQEFQIEDQMVITATTFKGKVYGVTSPGHALVVAEFTGPKTFQFGQLIRRGLRALRPETMVSFVYLIESENELLFVVKIYLGLSYHKEVTEFRVFKTQFSDMKWVEVESIEGRTIFLDGSRGISASSILAGTRENCIYFTNFKDRNLYIFDLEERSLSVSLPCPAVSRHESISRWV